MKKAIYLILFIAAVSIGYSLYYVTQYHIDDDRTAIQSSLKEWSNRGSGDIDPKVREVIQLDNTSSYIVLFQTESNNIGYAHYIKGWNGKFKIDRSGHGTNVVSYEKIETNKGMYGILIGKNPSLKIDHIKADLYYEDFSFKANVSADERFVRYEQLPDKIEKPFPAELTFYDNNGAVVESTGYKN